MLKLTFAYVRDRGMEATTFEDEWRRLESQTQPQMNPGPGLRPNAMATVVPAGTGTDEEAREPQDPGSERARGCED